MAEILNDRLCVRERENGERITWGQKKGRGKGFFLYIGTIFAIGISAYSALCLFDIVRLGEKWEMELLKAVAGLFLLSAALSLLLISDKLERPSVRVEELKIPGLIYHILSERKSLFFFLIIGTVGVVYISYYTLASAFKVEYLGESGMVIKLPGRTVYYTVVDPYGWQKTDVWLHKNQRFEVEISGRVSPGYLENVVEKDEHLRLTLKESKKVITEEEFNRLKILREKLDQPIKWPFRGPGGYKDDFYPRNEEEKKEKGFPHYKKDDGLTVKGLPHNSVIGIIVGRNEAACYRNQTSVEPCTAKNGRAGYDWANEKMKELLLPLTPLGDEKIPIKLHANNSGYLWVTINDADAFRWDNSGVFLMKITIVD